MPVDFGPEGWAKTKRTYDAWWSGELDRPIVPVILWGRDPGRDKPQAPLLTQATCADLSVSPEDIIDRLDYELSTYEFVGDAFPMVKMDCFGPGIVAAFLGARLDNSTGSVWFHPEEVKEPSVLEFEYDPDNVWLRRIKDIYAAGMERWQGDVLMGMTDLGGTLDILSTFRPSSLLPMDLYDDPEGVMRLRDGIHRLWFRFMDELNGILQPINPGYSDWSGIYSDRPSYMLQCDFAYMIGPGMFDDFVLPELTDACRKLDRSFYHLDGPGQIPHLDSLLSIHELDGIQWIPGDGNGLDWDDLYVRIHGSGKHMQILGGLDHLDHVTDLLGTGKRICSMANYAPLTAPLGEAGKLAKRLERYGIGVGV